MYIIRKAYEYMFRQSVQMSVTTIIVLFLASRVVPYFWGVSATGWKWILGVDAFILLGCILSIADELRRCQNLAVKVKRMAKKRAQQKLESKLNKLNRDHLVSNELRVLLGVVLESLNAGVELDYINLIMDARAPIKLSVSIEYEFAQVIRTDSQGKETKIEPYGKLLLWGREKSPLQEIRIWED